MSSPLHIALIGDYDPQIVAHRAIPRALELAGIAAQRQIAPEWIGTATLAAEPSEQLAAFDGIWCVPGSPYAHMDGALGTIRFARKSGRAFLGTCGGFQHAVIEYARNVLGLEDADHGESNPNADMPIISLLSCSLVDTTGEIHLHPGSRIHGIYERDAITEGFHCRFGINEAYRERIFAGALRVSASDEQGETRAVELDEHPFFLATLFQPERSALREETSPLITAFVRAAGTATL